MRTERRGRNKFVAGFGQSLRKRREINDTTPVITPTAIRNGGEAITPVDTSSGSLAAWSSAKHALTSTDAANSGKTHRKDSRRGNLLRGVPRNEARL